MISFLKRMPAWVAVVAVAFLVAYGSLIQADPTDDLSLTLAHPTGSQAYRLMDESDLAAILADRLDLFPIAEAPKLAKHIMTLCREYRFDPAFVLSLIAVESAFKIKALSSVGAVGLMQVMPATARFVVQNLRRVDMGRFTSAFRQGQEIPVSALMDPYVNTALGIAYLSYLRDYYEGLPPYYLVAAYNIGPAKLDELRARKSFRPTATRKYYERIRSGIAGFRYYRRQARPELGV